MLLLYVIWDIIPHTFLYYIHLLAVYTSYSKLGLDKTVINEGTSLGICLFKQINALLDKIRRLIHSEN